MSGNRDMSATSTVTPGPAAAIPGKILSLLATADEVKPKRPQGARSIQRFVCNTGYKIAECTQQLAAVRSALAPYPLDRLGAWTWVLVKSEDWKPILRSLGGNPDSPTFSVLEERETFLEEALFAPRVARRAELLRIWSMPLDQLQNFAITHELGHAICMEKNEASADRFGRMLREGRALECRTK